MLSGISRTSVRTGRAPTRASSQVVAGKERRTACRKLPGPAGGRRRAARRRRSSIASRVGGSPTRGPRRAAPVQRLWRFGANAPASPSTAAGAARYTLGMQKVLVVDDDPHIRDVVCFALRRAGYQPLPAANGLAALELAAREMPALVVLDILMPELDGTEVCRRLRQGSDVPIIFLTSKDEEMDRILGLELGADDYVVKPFSPRELVARVKAVLRRKGPAVRPSRRAGARQTRSSTCEAIAASWDGAGGVADRHRVRLPEGHRRPAAPRLHAREPDDGVLCRRAFRQRPHHRQPCPPHPRQVPGGGRRSDRDGPRRRLPAGSDSEMPRLPRRAAACRASARCCSPPTSAVLLLPVAGIGFLRLYESALIRQTEAELLAQAAVLSAAYRAAWLEHAPRRERSRPCRWRRAAVWRPRPDSAERWRRSCRSSISPSLPILPRAPDAVPAGSLPIRSRSAWPSRWRRCWPTCAR